MDRDDAQKPATTGSGERPDTDDVPAEADRWPTGELILVAGFGAAAFLWAFSERAAFAGPLLPALAVDAYEVPDRVADRVRLTRLTCVFPHCTRPARACDLDHVDEYVGLDEGGPPGQTSTTNLAPLCRRHHRVKTHPSLSGVGRERRWRYRCLPGGTFVWTSPHDQQYLVDPHGTIPLPA
ncbi:HNH endonuclease signature motif containing protein [Nocardioides alkalitolerans]|uniref:HNH endonuclease signature motif containing protein n=1 Tax=Nocardioides alkalitolerans TaxID=281714 RepID=UPI00040CF96E|nr:HNH endonuclease signature motif containing protein [Nocardioides alkalitolerans]